MENTIFINSLIVDCITEFAVVIPKSNKLFNLAKNCLNEQIKVNPLSLMKLIDVFSKLKYSSYFDFQEINQFIFNSIENFFQCKDSEIQNIFFIATLSFI